MATRTLDIAHAPDSWWKSNESKRFMAKSVPVAGQLQAACTDVVKWLQSYPKRHWDGTRAAHPGNWGDRKGKLVKGYYSRVRLDPQKFQVSYEVRNDVKYARALHGMAFSKYAPVAGVYWVAARPIHIKQTFERRFGVRSKSRWV